jgi:tRNA-(ms[2]io[6]A)-hydroxylase
MPPIRRLPVLQESAAPDDGRPPWHWTLIGALFALSIWLPLAMLGLWMMSRIVKTPNDAPLDPSEHVSVPAEPKFWMALLATSLLTFLLACLASGALVGRFGNRAGPKEAAQGCAAAAIVAALGSAFQIGWGAALGGLMVLTLVGAVAGWGGGRLGWARRPLAERRPRA